MSGLVPVSIEAPPAQNSTEWDRVVVRRECIIASPKRRRGNCTIDKIVANSRRVLAETDAELQVRVHVDSTNIHEFEELIEFFLQNGWLDHSQVIIYANTVYQKDHTGKVITSYENSEIDRRLRVLTHSYRNLYTSAPAVHATRALRPAFEDGERFSLKGTYCSDAGGVARSPRTPHAATLAGDLAQRAIMRA